MQSHPGWALTLAFTHGWLCLDLKWFPGWIRLMLPVAWRRSTKTWNCGPEYSCCRSLRCGAFSISSGLTLVLISTNISFLICMTIQRQTVCPWQMGLSLLSWRTIDTWDSLVMGRMKPLVIFLYSMVQLNVIPWNRMLFWQKSIVYLPLGTARLTSSSVAIDSPANSPILAFSTICLQIFYAVLSFCFYSSSASMGQLAYLSSLGSSTWNLISHMQSSLPTSSAPVQTMMSFLLMVELTMCSQLMEKMGWLLDMVVSASTGESSRILPQLIPLYDMAPNYYIILLCFHSYKLLSIAIQMNLYKFQTVKNLEQSFQQDIKIQLDCQQLLLKTCCSSIWYLINLREVLTLLSYLLCLSFIFNIETQMAEEEGGAPYQFTNADGKTGNSSRDYTGEGHAIYPNGDQYLGDYVNGQRTGKGKYLYANGDRYEGAFVSNKKHGIGRFITKDKGQYYGQFENGIKHGEGTYVYANKDSYSGWWMFGKKHGQGTYTYNETGAKLVGEWAENQIVKGRWLFTNGTYYEGNFSNNKPNGDGTWRFSNGNTVPGQYKQTVIPNEDPDDKKVNIKLQYQSNVGISESAWQINAHEIF